MRFLSFFLSFFFFQDDCNHSRFTDLFPFDCQQREKKKKKERGETLPAMLMSSLSGLSLFFFFSRPFDLVELVPFFFSFSHREIWLAAWCRRWRFTCWRPSFHLFFFFFIFFLFLSTLILPCRQAMIWQGNKIFSGNLIHAAVVTIPLDLLAQVQKWKRSWLKKNNRQN